MGCGESKHAVATANSTITRRKTKQTTKPFDDSSCKNESVEVKDTAEDKELKGNINEGQEQGRLISKESPNRYFSSRKDEDVEGIVSSDKSECVTPCIGSEKESLFHDCDKTEDVAEIKESEQEQENGDIVVRKEDGVAKEAIPGTSISQDRNPGTENEKNSDELIKDNEHKQKIVSVVEDNEKGQKEQDFMQEMKQT